MLPNAVLTLAEYVMREPLRLATIHEAMAATDLEPLWTAMGAPPAVRSTFEDLRRETATATATDGDDFY
jgi:hypothetical protein